MSKTLYYITTFIVAIFAAACGGSSPTISTANANANAAVKVDQANMPPGLSASPIGTPANLAPGISANGNTLTKGPTPTPGIPSEKDLKKPFKPGATPTPGIPDPDAIRKAMGTKPTMVNPSTNSNSSMMMKKKPTPDKP